MGKGFGVALVFLLTFSAIGEEPLPVVTARAPLPQVTTEVEPAHETAPVTTTIADAARSGDFTAFNALYAAHPTPAFADLHELWSYSQTDRFGAFFGEELHARLARRYPGFAAYIDDYRVVDSHGVAFWPTAETRAFLLERALSGAVAAPEIRVVASGEQRSAIRRTAPQQRRVARVAAVPKPAPAPALAVAVPEPVAAPVPPITDRRPPLAQQQQRQAPQPAPNADNAATGRGIFLMILGLIGVGVLTLMLRTPPEEESEPGEVITALKLTSPRSPAEDQQPRKTGSHG
ncbi:MAG TPA: hypothetical protein VGR02_00755 [Thermoanaerobaculia bacterium]|nr:hypothetical protein [Thermoanaerobaculia bacterium]